MHGAQLPPRYRPMPLPLPFPVVKREPLRYYRPESLPMPPAPVKREPPPPDLYPVFNLVGKQVRMYATALAVVAGVMAVLHLLAVGFDPEARLFVRLVAAEGLGVGVGEPREQSPLFKLAVDVDMIPDKTPLRLVHAGGGDGDHMLRVSYRGVVLAWGAVPRFTIRHSLAGVVTVVTTAQGSVLREDMRKLIRAELQALGKVEFEADGDIPGLGGHLHCKFFLAGEDQLVDSLRRPPCLVQKKTN